jgi:hypothetical protein
MARMSRSLALFAVLAVTVVSPAVVSKTTAERVAKFGNEAVITPARLKDHLEFIASDEMEGRDTPSRGLDIATLYVATQLKLWGATPMGDNGTFFQSIKLSRRATDTEASVITIGNAKYTYGDGFKRTFQGGTGSGSMVFVGHGYVVPGKGINPYAGVDVKGKVLVALGGRPRGVEFSDMRAAGTLDPLAAAKKEGATGIIVIPDAEFLRRWTTDNGKQISQMEIDPTGGAPVDAIPSVFAGPSLVKRIFAGESLSAEDLLSGVEVPEKAVPLDAGKVISLSIKERREEATARNVVAAIPGTDAKLKQEYVAFGAHIDHVGMATSGSGDRIFNGADDDGSGTVSILEIAHAYLTGPRPKRSLLFVWHVGEEKGLWGSEYYTNNPTVDLKNIVSQLNIDMIGRSRPAGDTNPANNVLTGPNEIYVVGSTKMSTDLQKTSEKTNADFLKIKFNYKYDDPADREQIFYRSDHYNYARKGIPIIFYFDGVHEDYHRPGDEVSKIDFEKMSRVARTVYATGWNLANAKNRPVVDKPLKG